MECTPATTVSVLALVLGALAIEGDEARDPVSVTRGVDTELDPGVSFRFDGLQSKILIDPDSEQPVIVLGVDLSVFGEAGCATRMQGLEYVNPQGSEPLSYALDGI